MNTSTEYFTASDGKQIALHSWIPDGGIQGVLQISHGMTEYAKRYAPFAEILTENGFAVFAHDHRGHGETAESQENLGFLAEKNGFNRVVLDLREIIEMLHSRFQNKKIFLFAHSFGSFVGQAFIERYGTLINGCILSGTAGPRILLGKFSYIFASVLCAFFGPHRRLKFPQICAFGTYNKHIKNPQSTSAWLSRDADEVKKYDDSPLCGFLPTVSFFKDLGYGLSVIHTKKAITGIPRQLPIFIFCGTEDPVGSYSKTVRRLSAVYKKTGIADVAEKYYDGGRHEMLNEINKHEVEQDILSWLKKNI